MEKKLVVIRGAGDIATGVIQSLLRAGYRTIALESDYPSAIRRTVALSNAVYYETYRVEDIQAKLCYDSDEALNWSEQDKELAILIDPDMKYLPELKPDILIDAILAKKNQGLSKELAPYVIALGPGFIAGKDCHCVVETMRGHKLASLIYKGEAIPNTGVPGLIGGESVLRVIHAPAAGRLRLIKNIGDDVDKNETIAVILPLDDYGNLVLGEKYEVEVKSQIKGLIRGLLPDSYLVKKGMKMADVDPRYEEKENIYLISDKARAIGNACLCAILADEYEKSSKLNCNKQVEAYLFSFDSSNEAILFEKKAVDNNWNGHLIPSPSDLKAGCGLSYLLDLNEKYGFSHLNYGPKSFTKREMDNLLLEFKTLRIYKRYSTGKKGVYVYELL